MRLVVANGSGQATGAADGHADDVGGVASLAQAAFSDKLQSVLTASDFDGFVERQGAPLYALRRGRPSLPLRRYFRMLLIAWPEQNAHAEWHGQQGIDHNATEQSGNEKQAR